MNPVTPWTTAEPAAQEVPPRPGGRSVYSASGSAGAAEVDKFVSEVLAEGGAARVSSLLAQSRPGELYRIPSRHGVAVTAVPTSRLSEAELQVLLQFRWAEYLQVGFVDRGVAFAQRIRSEPTDVVGADDVHLVAGDVVTGRVLCYLVIRQPPKTAVGTRLRSTARDLFPVERVHGPGVYQRLPILPDLVVDKIRELGRFVRSHALDIPRHLLTRAVIEIGVALFQVMSGPLRTHVDAVIGDLETDVAKHNLDFFHVPTAVITGTVPVLSAASYFYPRYLRHEVHPFAAFISDTSAAQPRLDAIERALELPAGDALVALAELAAETTPRPSSFQPGSAGLHETVQVPQRKTQMDVRRSWRERGVLLQRVDAFASLSVAEATLLASLMEPVRISAGQSVARRGDQPAALLIVDSGELALVRNTGTGQRETIRRVGPLEYCGHEGMLSGAGYPADIVATSQAVLLRLNKENYDRYVAALPDVELSLTRSALRQLAALEKAPSPAIRELVA
jgi:hypothetical protein